MDEKTGFSVAPGSKLPSGLTLSEEGVLSGVVQPASTEAPGAVDQGGFQVSERVRALMERYGGDNSKVTAALLDEIIKAYSPEAMAADLKRHTLEPGVVEKMTALLEDPGVKDAFSAVQPYDTTVRSGVVSELQKLSPVERLQGILGDLMRRNTFDILTAVDQAGPDALRDVKQRFADSKTSFVGSTDVRR